MSVKIELKGISAKSAFQFAIASCPKTQDQIMNEMDWTPNIACRFFSTEGYFPKYPTLPKLCEVLGNTIIIDWLRINSTQTMNQQKPFEAEELLFEFVKMTETQGLLAEEIRRACVDNKISQDEAIKILRKVKNISRIMAKFVAKLDPELYEDEE